DSTAAGRSRTVPTDLTIGTGTRLIRVSMPATAIIDVQATGEMPRWLKGVRGIGVRQVRLACGLVMFSYVFSHFVNHSFGNLSFDLMDRWLAWHMWWWRLPLVAAVLY